MSLSTRKRRKRCSIDSSSDDDLGYSTPFKIGETSTEKSTRSSDRISARKNRSFKMPSRDDVWDSILPTKSPDKYYHLKPRKLINNFTKENNSYNYDPNVTSGSESMEDFIDDDIQYINKRKKKKTVHRIKNRRTRVIQESPESSSSSTDSHSEENTSETKGLKQDEGHNAIEKDTGIVCGIKQEVDTNAKDGVDNGNGNNDLNIVHSNLPTTANTEDDIRKHIDHGVLSQEIKKENSCSQDTGSVNVDSPEDIQSKNIKEEKSECEMQSRVCKSGSDNDSNFGENLVKSKRKRRKSKVLGSDSEDECIIEKDEQEPVSIDQCPTEIQLEDQLEDQLEYEVEDEDIVNINDDSDDNDSFIVDDDCESDIEDNTDSGADDISGIVDNESDPEEGTSSGRKKHVRVKMAQKKKERDKLFDEFREARKRKQAKEKIESNNNKT